MVFGILMALSSSFFSALRESTRKHLSQDLTSVQIGLVTQFYGTVILLPVAIWRYSLVGLNLTPTILGTVLASGAIVLIATYIYIEAMRISDISMTEPLRKTTPIFVAVLEPLVLGISFKISVIIGAVLGTLGAYIMVSEDGFLTPIQNFKNKGALMSILVAFIFSIWALIIRFGATRIDPLIFAYLIFIVGLIGFGFWSYLEERDISLEDFLRKDSAGLGFFTAVASVTGFLAFSVLSASEVTILKQATAIFGVLIGHSFFGEEEILRKFIGALIIIAGVSAIML